MNSIGFGCTISLHEPMIINTFKDRTYAIHRIVGNADLRSLRITGGERLLSLQLRKS